MKGLNIMKIKRKNGKYVLTPSKKHLLHDLETGDLLDEIEFDYEIDIFEAGLYYEEVRQSKSK